MICVTDKEDPGGCKPSRWQSSHVNEGSSWSAGSARSAAAAVTGPHSQLNGIPANLKQAAPGYLVTSFLQRHFSPRPASKLCYQGVTRFTIKGLLYVEREVRGFRLPPRLNLGQSRAGYSEQRPSTISSTVDLWTENAIENLDQCMKWRIEAVVINHRVLPLQIQTCTQKSKSHLVVTLNI